MFYLGASLLVGAAALLVAWALGRSAPAVAPAESREQTVKALYRDRRKELERELEGTDLAPAEREALERELGAALLADSAESGDPAAAPAAAPLPSQSSSRALLVLSVALLAAGSLGVYSVVGDPQAPEIAGAEAVLRLDREGDAAALATWQQRLGARVADRPGDAKSWYLLGHVGLKREDYAAAAQAFATAHALHGDDPSIDLYWLQARYLAARGELDGTSRAIAERILAGSPNQPMVLELLAIDAYRQGSFREAVSLLNRALSAATDPGHAQALAAGLDEARKRLGDLSPSLDVEVTAPGAPAGATLFVIARPVGGGMPFAVVKRPAGSLPRTVRLDDAVSMNPAAPLSAAGTVEVVVRISRSGTAMAHPGDWEWRSEPLTLAGLSEPVTLTAQVAPPGP